MEFHYHVALLSVLVQLICFFTLISSGFFSKNIVSLRTILAVASLFYFTIPLAFLSDLNQIIINDSHVFVGHDELIRVSVTATVIIISLFFVPNEPLECRIKSNHFFRFLFLILSIFSWVEFVRLIFSIDFDHASRLIFSPTPRDYRDYAYSLLVTNATSYSRYTNIVAFATGILLWKDGKTNRCLLSLGLFPIVAMDILTLSRLALGSFLVMVACIIPRGKVIRLLPVIVVLSFVAFFYRTVFLILTDAGYTRWLGRAFSPAQFGLESFGEFFNTFGTNFMVANLGIKNYDGLNLFIGAGVLPPGMGKFWYEFTGVPFQIDYIAELILNKYQVHPAHSSLVDYYIFGPLALLGFGLYLLVCRFALRSNFEISSLMYLVLVGFYYLPFRGSMVLSASRLVWLYIILAIFYFLFNKALYHFNAFRNKP